MQNIAELRRRAVYRLAELSTNKDGQEVERAKHFFNCLYRANGTEGRLLILENDYDLYTRNHNYIKRLQDQQERAIDRLRNMVSEYKDVQLYISGGYINLVKRVNNAGGVADLNLCFYY